MASQSENVDRLEEGAPAPCTTQPEQEQFEANQVLEIMRSLIIEIQSFKEDNEKLKRDKEKNQEINQILLQILQEKNNGEKPKIEIWRDPKVGESAERKGSSSNRTQKYEN